MVKKIVVPLDGSKLAEGVLPNVRELAHCLGCKVVLLQVLTHKAYDYLVSDPGMSASLRESRSSGLRLPGRCSARLKRRVST